MGNKVIVEFGNYNIIFERFHSVTHVHIYSSTH